MPCPGASCVWFWRIPRLDARRWLWPSCPVLHPAGREGWRRPCSRARPSPVALSCLLALLALRCGGGTLGPHGKPSRDCLLSRVSSMACCSVCPFQRPQCLCGPGSLCTMGCGVRSPVRASLGTGLWSTLLKVPDQPCRPRPTFPDGTHPASSGCPELTGQWAVGGSSRRLLLPSAAPGSFRSEELRFQLLFTR